MLNKVILIGNLGQDPSLSKTKNGNSVLSFSVATSERWTDKVDGIKQERTEWHRVVVWGRQAEVLGEYLSKGRQVYVEGRIESRSWTGKDGKEREDKNIIASTVRMLGSKSSHSESSSENVNYSVEDIPF